MYLHNNGGFSLDFTLMAPASFTFRLREGVCGLKPEPLLGKIESVVKEALVKISAAGRWPDAEYLYDATHENSSR